MNRHSFLIFGGGELPWIYPLGVELSGYGPTEVVRIQVAAMPWRRPGAWPFEDHPPGLKRSTWRYPPGYNRRLARIFRPLIRARLERHRWALRAESGVDPHVILTDPSLEKYTEGVEGERLVYLNYDDLSSYDAESGRFIEHPSEARLVTRAGTILCSSIVQRDRMGERFPAKADSVFHLPHGVHDLFVNPTPAARPASGAVCVVGSLTARYDWALIDEVVSRLPGVTFTFAGEIGRGAMGPAAPDWEARMASVLDRSNVRHVTGLRHRETSPIYWESAATWLPYDASLPFVKASSPLKLADSLASGRPIVSANVPECRLHPEWIRIYRSADEAVALLSGALASSNADDAGARSVAQVRYSVENGWRSRAARLVAILERGP